MAISCSCNFSTSASICAPLSCIEGEHLRDLQHQVDPQDLKLRSEGMACSGRGTCYWVAREGRGAHRLDISCVSSAGASFVNSCPHKMKGVRALCLIAREASAAGVLESRLRQSCTFLTNLRDFNPLLPPATEHQSNCTLRIPFSDCKGAFPLTGLASSHLLARQVDASSSHTVMGQAVLRPR